jgi:glutaredoxin
VAKFEIYGSAHCPHTQEMREWLEWRRVEFIEYDVELDPAARVRMKVLTGGQRTVPVLVENGVVSQIGWQGRGCVVNTD